MNQKERMLANLPYKSWMDGLKEERMACKQKLYKYNNLPPEAEKEREALLREILGKVPIGHIAVAQAHHLTDVPTILFRPECRFLHPLLASVMKMQKYKKVTFF